MNGVWKSESVYGLSTSACFSLVHHNKMEKHVNAVYHSAELIQYTVNVSKNNMMLKCRNTAWIRDSWIRIQYKAFYFTVWLVSSAYSTVLAPYIFLILYLIFVPKASFYCKSLVLVLGMSHWMETPGKTSQLAWKEQESVAGDREVCLGICHCDPH